MWDWADPELGPVGRYVQCTSRFHTHLRPQPQAIPRSTGNPCCSSPGQGPCCSQSVSRIIAIFPTRADGAQLRRPRFDLEGTRSGERPTGTDMEKWPRQGPPMLLNVSAGRVSPALYYRPAWRRRARRRGYHSPGPRMSTVAGKLGQTSWDTGTGR